MSQHKLKVDGWDGMDGWSLGAMNIDLIDFKYRIETL